MNHYIYKYIKKYIMNIRFKKKIESCMPLTLGPEREREREKERKEKREEKKTRKGE